MDKSVHFFSGLLILCLNAFVSGEYGIKIIEKNWKFENFKLSWISNCETEVLQYRINYRHVEKEDHKNNLYTNDKTTDIKIRKTLYFDFDSEFKIIIFDYNNNRCKSEEIIIKTPSEVQLSINNVTFDAINIFSKNCTNATKFNLKNCVNGNCSYIRNQAIQLPISLMNSKPNTKNAIRIEYLNDNKILCLSKTLMVQTPLANVEIKSNLFISDSAVLNVTWKPQYIATHYNIRIFENNIEFKTKMNLCETTYVVKIHNYSSKNVYGIKIEGYLENSLVSEGEENGVKNVTLIEPTIRVSNMSLCTEGKFDMVFNVYNFSQISNNYFYVVVVDEVDKTEEENKLENFIKFEDVEVGKNKWIAFEKKFTDKFSEIRTTIGDNLNLLTMLGNYINKVLHLDKEYSIVFFVYSRYENISRFSKLQRRQITCSRIQQPETPPSDHETEEHADADVDNFPIILIITIIIIIILLITAGVAYYVYRKKLEPFYDIIEKIPMFKPQISDVSNRLKIEELDQFLRTPNVNEIILQEHKKIPRIELPVYGQNFRSKNRYDNALPIKNTRVILERINNLESKYINANYVTYSDGVKAYIATQGPKPETFNDFWRMMWEQNADTIVMLTNLVEKGVKKCDKYWPNLKETLAYGNFSVYCKTIYKFSQYECRIFTLKFNNSKREITQFHYTHWPDHSLPIVPHAIVDFVTKVRECGSTPVVVHCSAGIGRTGSFILCNLCVESSKQTKHVDIPKMLSNVRECRLNALSDKEQYKLCYCVINELLNGKDTSISLEHLLTINLEQIITQQFRYANNNDYWLDIVGRKAHPFFTDNINKNRNRIPYKSCKSPIFLPRDLDFDDNCDYINAVNVDEDFICTQQPLPNTLGDFWRLVDHAEANLIVSLHEINPNNFNSLIFWPTLHNFSLKPASFIDVDLVSKAEEKAYDLTLLRIINHKTEETNFLNFLHFKKWDGESYPNEVDFLNFYQAYLQVVKPGKIILTCIDGAKGCGVFLSYLKIMKQIKEENVFDACGIIRSLRYSRDDFMQNFSAFNYVYNLVQRCIINEKHCYEEISTYNNIS